MTKMKSEVAKVCFGGWYQRTTLHLSEVYELLSEGKSDLNLSKDKLKALFESLDLKSVTREADYLEYIHAFTNGGIEIKYYEDGLYVFGLESENIDEAAKALKEYYEEKFAPAISYIFSLGAPTPKILANLKTMHPIAVMVEDNLPEKYKVDEAKYGKVYSSIVSKEITVIKTPGYIFLVGKERENSSLEVLIEMQIFFREFKDQLQKYLNIHRNLWEKISKIKERKSIKGSDVENLRILLDAYQKTINLIESRINQMGTYVHTRASVAKEAMVTEHLAVIFQYKFDVLTNTLSYVKEIWTMTKNYLNAAIQVINEIKSQATNKSIQSLQIITTYGVVGGIIGYLSRDSLPKITGNGLIFFVFLIVSTFVVNKLVSFGYTRSRYKMTFAESIINL